MVRWNSSKDQYEKIKKASNAIHTKHNLGNEIAERLKNKKQS